MGLAQDDPTGAEDDNTERAITIISNDTFMVVSIDVNMGKDPHLMMNSRSTFLVLYGIMIRNYGNALLIRIKVSICGRAGVENIMALN